MSEPRWLSHARRSVSEIGPGSGDAVTLYTVAEDAATVVSCLHLEPGRGCVEVRGAEGERRGSIRSELVIPGLKHAMRRDDERVWTLSVRSVVRRSHALQLASGESWRLGTPFFWKLQIAGETSSGVHLVGNVGKRKHIWWLWLEPDRDTPDLLAAIAFLHRGWWRA